MAASSAEKWYDVGQKDGDGAAVVADGWFRANVVQSTTSMVHLVLVGTGVHPFTTELP